VFATAAPRLTAPTGRVAEPGALRLVQATANPTLAAAFTTPPAEPVQADLRAGMIREMERISGHSLVELAEIQREFIARKAAGKFTSPGNYMRRLTEAEGMGGNTARYWTSLSEAEKQAHQRRFDAMVQELRGQAPEELVRLLDEAEAAGGGLRFEPQRCEEAGGSRGAYAFSDGAILGASIHLLRDAERDPSRVFANIAHELGGHWKYGDTVSWELTEAVLEGMSSNERRRAQSGDRHLHSVYAYPETEIIAELHEMKYSGTPANDKPRYDIPAKLRDIKSRYAPEVAKALVCGLRWRVQRDPTVSQEARDFLDTSIRNVFRLRFVSPTLQA
jgi:hypothetical protein